MTIVAPIREPIATELPQFPLNAPERARTLAAKGKAALKAGRYKEALESFKTLGTLKHVEGASYLSKLGIHMIWSRQGEYPKALKVLKEALGLGNDRLVLLWIGVTLNQAERHGDALKVFDKVKESWPDDPDVWVYQIAPLVSLEKSQAALESAEQAFSFRHNASDYGKLLYESVGGLTVLLGFDSLKRRWLPDLEKATKAFIQWRERARRDGQIQTFNEGVKNLKQMLPEEDLPAFEEFMLGVRLASIRNPFRRWEALGKEISKDWPKDVSAVEAIREQRRW